jgi:hypothetical protein
VQRSRRDWRWALLVPVLLVTALAACSIDEPVDPEPVPEVTVIPASGSVDHSVPVTLAWDLDPAIVWGDSFTVLCDTTRPPRVEVYAGTEASCTVGDLLDGRTYFWQVAATDSAGEAYTLGPWSFATRPFLCTVSPEPVDLTTNLEIDPFLRWSVASASDTPSYYLAYVDTVNPPQELAYAGADSVCRLYGLEYETEYWWRITAVDGSDNTDSSGPWTFTTGPPLFLVDLAPTPADSSSELDRVVTLSWNVLEESAPTENWVVFLDDTPQPTTLVHAGTETEVTLTDLQYGRTYWWAVTAFDAEGHTFTNGPWRLAIRDFDVALEPSPADGSTQVATTGSLSWQVTRGADMIVNYLVCLDAHPQPTTPVYAGPLSSLDLGSLALAPGTTYWWKVTALDIDGFTCPLDPWSFTTAP